MSNAHNIPVRGPGEAASGGADSGEVAAAHILPLCKAASIASHRQAPSSGDVEL